MVECWTFQSKGPGFKTTCGRVLDFSVEGTGVQNHQFQSGVLSRIQWGLSSGVLSEWGFVRMGVCLVGFCPSGVLSSGVLSEWGFFLDPVVAVAALFGL